MSSEQLAKLECSNGSSPIFANAWFCGLLAVTCSAFYVAAHLQTGWYPYDDGQLGQAAERVLNGELPHRDFDEMYSGGLTYVNALSFHLFGVRSESMRWMMMFFFVPFSISVFAIARRACPAWAAGLVTFFCATITLPVYSAAMPSWYNLFFFTFGIYFLIRFIESEHKHWIICAGLAAGISMIFKVTGVYFLAAAMLFMVFHEQSKSEQHATRPARFLWIYDAFVVGCLLIFASLSSKLVLPNSLLPSFVHFCFPVFGVAAFLVFKQFKHRFGNPSSRFYQLLSLQLPLIAGCAVPVLAWIVFYLNAGAVDSLYQGMIVQPQQRLASASTRFPDLGWLILPIILIGVFTIGFWDKKDWVKKNAPIVTLAIGIFIFLIAIRWEQKEAFMATFFSLRNLGPFVPLVAIGILLWNGRKGKSNDDSILFLLLAASSVGGLIQFPFASDMYFFYFAPIVALCVVMISKIQRPSARLVHCATLGVAILFSVFHLNSHVPNANITGTHRAFVKESVGLPRCSLTVSGNMANMYRQAVAEIKKHAGNSEYIYAGPDFPEAYFLSGRKNPTTVFYDFFQPEFQQNPNQLIEQLDLANVNVVAIKRFQVFSPLNPEFEKAIHAEFPNQKNIAGFANAPKGEGGIAFTIYWRETKLTGSHDKMRKPVRFGAVALPTTPKPNRTDVE